MSAFLSVLNFSVLINYRNILHICGIRLNKNVLIYKQLIEMFYVNYCVILHTLLQ